MLSSYQGICAKDLQLTAQQLIRIIPEQNQCQAVGSVRVTTEEWVLTCDHLVIDFDRSSTPSANQAKNLNFLQSSRQIRLIRASGHVLVHTRQGTAKAGKMSLDCKTNLIRLQEGPISLTTQNYRLQAGGYILYNNKTGRAMAQQDVIFTYKDSVLKCPKLWCAFDSSSKGLWGAQFTSATNPQKKNHPSKTASPALQRAFAWGPVVLRQKKQWVKADQGTYDGKQEKVFLKGHVAMFYDQHYGRGHAGVVDLKHHTGHLVGCPTRPSSFLLIPSKRNAIFKERASQKSSLFYHKGTP